MKVDSVSKKDKDITSFRVADLQELGARKQRKKRLVLIGILVGALLLALGSIVIFLLAHH